MPRILILAIMAICSMETRAEEVRLRNMELITINHQVYLQGTALNVSGRPLPTVFIDFAILKDGKVAANQTVEAHAVDPGQAWRIWLPIATKAADGFRVDRIGMTSPSLLVGDSTTKR
ncbi:hypothetical protein AvCA_41170 [Azotobacter vinelandii CA]|uniref:Uncharacterized protein n=5 Tax=Azotobacter group TaxID=351 RepID=C1DES1_AZOVD|nr:hypothetical protein Avin_41170 [Azotobacter vinelandii DJ]AGK14446.1 hypothetical protein AvCA_41170 [Azotobacter vinelandii CA]AGK21798.1 hypothetical protein AvCA6_41170 [Azotobacter vinelandii CA6]